MFRKIQLYIFRSKGRKRECQYGCANSVVYQTRKLAYSQSTHTGRQRGLCRLCRKSENIDVADAETTDAPLKIQCTAPPPTPPFFFLSLPAPSGSLRPPRHHQAEHKGASAWSRFLFRFSPPLIWLLARHAPLKEVDDVEGMRSKMGGGKADPVWSFSNNFPSNGGSDDTGLGGARIWRRASAQTEEQLHVSWVLGKEGRTESQECVF